MPAYAPVVEASAVALLLDGVHAEERRRALVSVLASLRPLAWASLEQLELALVPASEAQLVALVAYKPCWKP